MASLLPIIGTVAGTAVGGPAGGAIGGGLGSLAGSYAEKGSLEGEDVGKAALSAGLGYIGGGGFGGGAKDAVAGAAGAAAKGAADVATPALSAAAEGAAHGAGAAGAAGAASGFPTGIGTSFANAVAPAGTAAPALAAAPAAAAPVSAAGTSSVTPWLGRPGMMGMTRGENIGYAGLAALGSLGSSGGGAEPPRFDPHRPTLSSTPTQRRFASPQAGYRPGIDPENRYFQAADGGLVPQLASGGSVVSGGKITQEPTGTYMTTPDGRRYVQKSEKDFGWDRMLGIPGLLGAYAGDNESWEAAGYAPPVLATTPIDRGFTPAPAGYQHGTQGEWQYFHDPVPQPVKREGMAGGGGVRAGRGMPSRREPEFRPMIPLDYMSDEDLQRPRGLRRAGEPDASGRFSPREEMIQDSMEEYRRGRERDVYPEEFAQGGLANSIPGYIRGGGDGLSDSIRGTIDGREPVDLSSGEFVIPARTVSGLGNGSSEAGARKLHRMMQRIDQARTRMAQGGMIDERAVLPA